MSPSRDILRKLINGDQKLEVRTSFQSLFLFFCIHEKPKTSFHITVTQK